MSQQSFAGFGLAIIVATGALAACSSTELPDEGQAGAGGAAAGTSAGGKAGSAGTSGATAAGGTAGSTAGSSAMGGSAGAAVAGSGGTPVAGTGGTPGAGTGGAIGGAGGTPPVGGTGGDTGGTAGTGIGGAGAGGAGAGGAGAGGGSGGAPSGDPTVHLDQLRQEMRGFGINNNWVPAMSDQDADTMFSNGEGQLGMNVLRIGMSSTGEPYNGQNCYADIDKFVARGGEYIIGTLWSPPANCKDNGSVNNGGHLLESCYESWSNTIAAFPGKVAANSDGELYAMSPQNEVDFASCGFNEPCNGMYETTVMTGAEAAAFMKIVGPKLRAAGTLPMSVEASEWIHVWSNESACCSTPSNLPSSDPLDCGFPPTNCPPGAPFEGYEYGHALHADPDAWAAFDIMGTHQYDSQIAYTWPAEVTPKKEVWQTEMSGVKWWPEQGEEDAEGVLTTCSTHIQNGVAVARWMHSGITVGEASAWLYWWYKSIGTDDNEGLICKDGRMTKRHSTFGQFSKYIRPGHHMVNVTGVLPDKVLLAASLSPEGTVVVVAINETDAAVEVPINITGGTAPAAMEVIQTSATDDLDSKPSVTLTAGVLTAALPAMSVTTFVSM